jgi:hypothetical protein
MEIQIPPLVTSSWLRDHAKQLNGPQLAGETCVYCAERRQTMVPVGYLGVRQLYACLPACDAALGRDRP